MNNKDPGAHLSAGVLLNIMVYPTYCRPEPFSAV